MVNYEQARLIFAGRENLAAKVEHIAASEGDGAGFDGPRVSAVFALLAAMPVGCGPAQSVIAPVRSIVQ